MGVVSVDSIDEINGREPVIIRSHGVKRDIYARLREMGLDYIDATELKGLYRSDSGRRESPRGTGDPLELCEQLLYLSK